MSISSKYATFTQCCFADGPASATLAHQWNNIGSTSCVCWVCSRPLGDSQYTLITAANGRTIQRWVSQRGDSSPCVDQAAWLISISSGFIVFSQGQTPGSECSVPILIYHLICTRSIISSPWIWKDVSATLWSGRYTFSHPGRRCILIPDTDVIAYITPRRRS